MSIVTLHTSNSRIIDQDIGYDSAVHIRVACFSGLHIKKFTFIFKSY